MLAYIGSPVQWLILILVCLVLFGAKRLPQAARWLGRSLGEFSKARRVFEDEFRGAYREASREEAGAKGADAAAAKPEVAQREERDGE